MPSELSRARGVVSHMTFYNCFMLRFASPTRCEIEAECRQRSPIYRSSQRQMWREPPPNSPPVGRLCLMQTSAARRALRARSSRYAPAKCSVSRQCYLRPAADVRGCSRPTMSVSSSGGGGEHRGPPQRGGGRRVWTGAGAILPPPTTAIRGGNEPSNVR